MLVPKNPLGNLIATFFDIGMPIYLPCGSDDAPNLNQIMSQGRQGQTILVIPGQPYLLGTPVRPQGGASIVSLGLTGISSKGTTSDLGSAVFTVLPTFTAPPGDPAPGAFEFLGSGDGGQPNSNQGGLSGIWVDNRQGPGGAGVVAAISVYGQYGAGTLEKILVRGNPAATFGDGLVMQRGAGSGKQPDGWQLIDSVYQSCGGVGCRIMGASDLTAINVHAQNTVLDTWWLGSGLDGAFHARLIGCRGDVSATGAGFHIDNPIASNPLDGIVLTDTDTQLNATYGIDFTNSHGTRSCPVKVVGGTFDGDTLAAFHVAGPNSVTFAGADSMVTGGLPPVALITDTVTGAPPDQIMVGGGAQWGASSGTAVITDNAGMIAAGTLVIEPSVTSPTGSGLTGFTMRAGSTTIGGGGTAVVNNRWLQPGVRVFAGQLSGAAAAIETTVGAGTMTISGAPGATVCWALI